MSEKNETICTSKSFCSYKSLIYALTLSIGPALGGYFIGKAIEHFKTMDRSVTVKGLSERVVKSDLAQLHISFKDVGNDLTVLEAKMAKNREHVIAFAKEFGFKPEEIAMGTLKVTDRQARDYGNMESKERYVFEDRISISTNRVDDIGKVLAQLPSLINKGVVATADPVYMYTKFGELRNDMIAEATKSARNAANQFAMDSGVKVGPIRSANQGSFSIVPKDETAENQYNRSETTSLEKKIRVVSTVTFTLM